MTPLTSSSGLRRSIRWLRSVIDLTEATRVVNHVRVDYEVYALFLAEAAHLTPGYFGDIIKKETGLTAQEIITRHIVERAKEWLACSTDDVSIIAYELGFQHPQHFSRMFKRVAGMSPTRFRDKTILLPE